MSEERRERENIFWNHFLFSFSFCPQQDLIAIGLVGFFNFLLYLAKKCGFCDFL